MRQPALVSLRSLHWLRKEEDEIFYNIEVRYSRNPLKDKVWVTSFQTKESGTQYTWMHASNGLYYILDSYKNCKEALYPCIWNRYSSYTTTMASVYFTPSFFYACLCGMGSRVNDSAHFDLSQLCIFPILNSVLPCCLFQKNKQNLYTLVNMYIFTVSWLTARTAYFLQTAFHKRSIFKRYLYDQHLVFSLMVKDQENSTSDQ